MPLEHEPVKINSTAAESIDAYFEYKMLVGNTDNGRLLSESEFNKIKEAASNPETMLIVHYINTKTGKRCRTIGPQSKCFCQHRYNDHSWYDYKSIDHVKCKIRKCPCSHYRYIPVRGSADAKCRTCKHSFKDHSAGPTSSCNSCRNCSAFVGSLTCACGDPMYVHETRFYLAKEHPEFLKERRSFMTDGPCGVYGGLNGLGNIES